MVASVLFAIATVLAHFNQTTPKNARIPQNGISKLMGRTSSIYRKLTTFLAKWCCWVLEQLFPTWNLANLSHYTSHPKELCNVHL